VNTIATYSNAGSRRRLQRHARQAVDRRLYCATNGCASLLVLDTSTGIARCRICGFTREVGTIAH
jgi:hypothetical protein